MKLYIDGLKDKYIRSFFTTAQGAAQTPYANKAVRAALDMEDIIWVRSRQVHRDSILAIEQKPETDLILDGYDAFVTDVPGVCLITAHADCIPVQLYDPFCSTCGNAGPFPGVYRHRKSFLNRLFPKCCKMISCN